MLFVYQPQCRISFSRRSPHSAKLLAQRIDCSGLAADTEERTLILGAFFKHLALGEQVAAQLLG
jgi:hypothetical protein